MNLRSLTAEEMVTVSHVLIDPTGDLRPIMENDDLLNGPLQVIEKAHNKLLPVQERAGANEQRIEYLTREMTRLDGIHDRKARGIYLTLDGCITLSLDTDDEPVFRGLQQKLYPNGRSISQRSYREQAGTAKRVEQRLSDDDRDELADITFGDHNLLDAVDQWLATARQIARLEAERARLKRDESDDGVSANQVREARLYWIRAINSLVDMIHFTDLDERDKNTLLANIEDAEQTATEARRRAQARAEQETDSADEPDEVQEGEEPASGETADEPDTDSDESEAEPEAEDDESVAPVE